MLAAGGGNVGKRGFQLARERVGGRCGFVGPLDDCDCLRSGEGLGELRGREGTETEVTRDSARAHAGRAQVIDDVGQAVGDGAHGDDEPVGVFCRGSAR